MGTKLNKQKIEEIAGLFQALESGKKDIEKLTEAARVLANESFKVHLELKIEVPVKQEEPESETMDADLTEFIDSLGLPKGHPLKAIICSDGSSKKPKHTNKATTETKSIIQFNTCEVSALRVIQVLFEQMAKNQKNINQKLADAGVTI
jgi:hypothetical protein